MSLQRAGRCPMHIACWLFAFATLVGCASEVTLQGRKATTVRAEATRLLVEFEAGSVFHGGDSAVFRRTLTERLSVCGVASQVFFIAALPLPEDDTARLTLERSWSEVLSLREVSHRVSGSQRYIQFDARLVVKPGDTVVWHGAALERQTGFDSDGDVGRKFADGLVDALRDDGVLPGCPVRQAPHR